MTHPLYVRVIDKQGREYPSIRACARAHGVNRRTVAYHLDTHGNLDRLGVKPRQVNPQYAAKPVTLGAHRWPSRKQAAASLGLSVSQFNRWTHPNATPLMRDMLLAALMTYSMRAAA